LTEKKRPRRRLSLEILGLAAACLALALVVFALLAVCATAVVESAMAAEGITPDPEQLWRMDRLIFDLSLLASVGFFVLLFLFLLGERLAYIGKISEGIDRLRRGETDYRLPLEGENELAALAQEINILSDTQQRIREKEMALAKDKEQFIRSLSHDIRTPLTSILSYSEFLQANPDCSPEQRAEYMELIGKKAMQIKLLSDILLSGGEKKTEHFEDARLLMEQLAAEFEEALEDDFSLSIDLRDCGEFSGSFDVAQLRRIFDNLASNVAKYADPEHQVLLSIAKTGQGLMIHQENRIAAHPAKGESYRLGLSSIRSIAQSYSGSMQAAESGDVFRIEILLSDF